MTEKIYDLNQLEQLSGGSEEFIKSMIDTFIEHTPEQVDKLKESYNNNDLKSMGAIAHKIKPSLDLMGIKEVYDDIRKIELYGKNEEDNEELSTLIEKVYTVCNTAFQQLKADFNI